MSRVLGKDEILNIMHGATLMGGGGGGSLSDGLAMLESYEKLHPEKPIQLTLLSVDEMKDDAFAAVTAGMGAPTAIAGKDFSVYAANAFNALKEYAAGMNPPRNLVYSIPVELGGFNTFVPMLISLLNDIPFVDCDGAGRAVPALTTLLLHVNGLNTSPLAMANGINDVVNIELADPKDAPLGEIIGRGMCDIFDGIAGLSGWMVKKDEIKEGVSCNSITMSENLGEILRSTVSGDDIFEKISVLEEITAKRFIDGQVTRVETTQESGFDYGEFDVQGEDGVVWTVCFQNENLVCKKGEEIIVTAPDVIALFDNDQRIALTNADVKEGMSVQLGVIKITDKWWKTGFDNVNTIWKEYFAHVKYEGDIVRYEF